MAFSPSGSGFCLAATVGICMLPVVAATFETADSDAGARMLRLAEGVYVIEHDDATGEWPHGNTGVIVGAAGAYVIDSCYLPSRARADIALIRRVTARPVRLPVPSPTATRFQASHCSPSATPRAGSSSASINGRRSRPRPAPPCAKRSRP